MGIAKTAGRKVMVERAMYWNSRGAGTDTVGGTGIRILAHLFVVCLYKEMYQ